MKVSQIIKQRRPLWQELEALCETLGEKNGASKLPPEQVSRFAALYRGACADLALSESYRLPPKTVDYLHRLVARSHNQLYRSKRYQWHTWYRKVFVQTPAQIFQDTAVQVAMAVFWCLFFVSVYLAYERAVWPDFAVHVMGGEAIEQMESSFKNFGGRSWGENMFMANFYIINNGSIGLFCFIMMLFVVPGFMTLSFNAVYLGCAFGVMLRCDSPEASQNFFNFVTAHGPLELTAIALSAGAGLRIGVSWWFTGGYHRFDNLIHTARQTIPIAMCAVLLFVLAAMVEGFVSPHPDTSVGWWAKALIAAITSGMLMFYFVVLGFPRDVLEAGA
jgi:uncharacterized membrane protein SpoIIM required for sporulation